MSWYGLALQDNRSCRARRAATVKHTRHGSVAATPQARPAMKTSTVSTPSTRPLVESADSAACSGASERVSPFTNAHATEVMANRFADSGQGALLHPS